MNHSEKAAELFLKGYNCAQAVTVAFCDVTGWTPEFAARTASAFGGGMGRLREVCGAVSGMFFVLGTLYGYDNSDADSKKKELYQQVQALAEQFKQINGSIICRELLENPSTDPTPSPRTAQYYAQRPCLRMVMTAADLLDTFIEENPI